MSSKPKIILNSSFSHFVYLRDTIRKYVPQHLRSYLWKLWCNQSQGRSWVISHQMWSLYYPFRPVFSCILSCRTLRITLKNFYYDSLRCFEMSNANFEILRRLKSNSIIEWWTGDYWEMKRNTIVLPKIERTFTILWDLEVGSSHTAVLRVCSLLHPVSFPNEEK